MSYDPSQTGPLAKFIGVIPTRLIGGISLLYLHGWTAAYDAWRHLWHSVPWGAIEYLQNASLPWPRVLALAAAGISFFTGASWILGFATRFASFIFLPVVLGALLVANRNELNYAAESCVLYFIISITLLVNGSGWFSVDAIFNAARNRSKVKDLYS
jgi:uncharacterized membrane protein YphA (DoxX/SURF4 family)